MQCITETESGWRPGTIADEILTEGRLCFQGLEFKTKEEENGAMKRYKGIVTGNTIVLDEKPDLPDMCPAIVRIERVDQTGHEITVRKQVDLNRPHHCGRLLYRDREELYDR